MAASESTLSQLPFNLVEKVRTRLQFSVKTTSFCLSHGWQSNWIFLFSTNCVNFLHRRPGFANTGIKWLPKWTDFWGESRRWDECWERDPLDRTQFSREHDANCSVEVGGVTLQPAVASFTQTDPSPGRPHTLPNSAHNPTSLSQSLTPRPYAVWNVNRYFVSKRLVIKPKNGKIRSCGMLNSIAQKLAAMFRRSWMGLRSKAQGFLTRQPRDKHHLPFPPLFCCPQCHWDSGTYSRTCSLSKKHKHLSGLD